MTDKDRKIIAQFQRLAAGQSNRAKSFGKNSVRTALKALGVRDDRFEYKKLMQEFIGEEDA